MITSQTYVLISVIGLAIVMILLVWVGKRTPKPLSKLSAIAFCFVIAGTILGNIEDNRLFSFSLIGIGVFFAALDMAKRLKK